MLLILSLVICIVGGGLLYAASFLSAPSPLAIGNPPADLGGESVRFTSATGQPLFGWFLSGKANQGGLLLLHGVRSHRKQMAARAKWLHDLGYSVLLFDFQAHGESPGKHITFGYLEAKDTEAAFGYLKNRIADRPVGVIGVSLGGAALLQSKIAPLVDAIVLEAVYSTLEKAVHNRLEIRLGALGKYVAPLLLWQFEPRLGFSYKQLAPIKQIGQLPVPIFIAAGSADVHTTLAETQALYDAAKSPKTLWVVQDATHQDLYSFAPEQYRQRVAGFFAKFLAE